jgi:hypothetical protein
MVMEQRWAQSKADMKALRMGVLMAPWWERRSAQLRVLVKAMLSEA